MGFYIKKKHLQVAIYSSAVILTVLLCTLIMYSLYVQWKKDSVDHRYRNSIYRITADLFREEIMLNNMDIKIERSGPFQGVPIVEGTLRNKSSKTIRSILVTVSFVTNKGEVLYKDWIYPLGEPNTDVHYIGYHRATSNMLPPGDDLSFRHLLKNCPLKIREQLFLKGKFAKKWAPDRVKTVYSIEGLTVS